MSNYVNYYYIIKMKAIIITYRLSYISCMHILERMVDQTFKRLFTLNIYNPSQNKIYA